MNTFSLIISYIKELFQNSGGHLNFDNICSRKTILTYGGERQNVIFSVANEELMDISDCVCKYQQANITR